MTILLIILIKKKFSEIESVIDEGKILPAQKKLLKIKELRNDSTSMIKMLEENKMDTNKVKSRMEEHDFMFLDVQERVVNTILKMIDFLKYS